MEDVEEKTYRIEKCDGKVQWDEFILEHGGHPMQLWGWGDARATVGWRIDRIFIVEDDRQIGAVQLLIKKLSRPFGVCLYVPRGPLVVENETAVYEQLMAYAKSNYSAVALIVEPNREGEPAGTGWRESDVHALPSRTMLLNLSKADGVLLADMTQATREQIRRAGEASLTIKKLSAPEDISLAYKLYRENEAQQARKPLKEKYFHELYDKLGEYGALFGAYADNELVSMIWLGLSEAEAVELYEGTSARGQAIAADYGLRLEVIRRVKQWGIPLYDIGGTNPQHEEDPKQGFGHALTDYGTFVLPLSPLYSLWARASRNRTNYAL